MGFLQRVSSVASPARMRATASQDATRAFWAGESGDWIGALSAAGVNVTPDLALTLSAMSSGVRMIGMDLATLPAQTFRLRDDGGKDRVKPIYGNGIDQSAGIGSLAYMLRWQPNSFQTATEFMLGQVAQYLLRGVAYAEIVNGPYGFLSQLLPRHPDRVTPERLPNGRTRYKLREYSGGPRYLTQDEMFVVRDLSFDGLNAISRVRYGSESLGSAIATQRAVGKFFKSGMTASTVASYTGDMEEEDERALHASITRYASGVENSFGLMLIPDDVKISNLSVDPDKAQMMLAQEWGVREVARLLNMPGSKLGIKDSVSYGSQMQSALDYVITCLRPIAVTFEQAIQRDLILAKDSYIVEYKLEALMRGDFVQQSTFVETLIKNRVMRPGTEARLLFGLNPDQKLDTLHESDMRPGTSSTGNNSGARPSSSDPSARASLKGTLALHDTAVRVLRREKHHVEALAKKFAADAPGWQAGLREFYAEHAGFVARELRLGMDTARAYAAQHGSQLEGSGIVIFDDAFERTEADELCALALDDNRPAA